MGAFYEVIEKLDLAEELKKKLKRNSSLLLILTDKEILDFAKISSVNQLPDSFWTTLNAFRKNFFKNHNQNQENESTKWVLVTNSMNLNSILDFGGLISRTLTLVYGKGRTGKTQFAHMMCVQNFLQFKNEQSIEGKKTIYIDTENTFRPERIIQMAHHLQLDSNSVLKSIDIFHNSTIEELSQSLNFLPKILKNLDITFIVIDSLTKIFRLALAEKPDKFNSIVLEFSNILQQLQQLATDFNIPILCTSQVTATFDNTYFFDVIPILSNTLNIYIKQFLLFVDEDMHDKNSIGRRYVHLINGELKKEAIVRIKITKNGIEDDFG